MFSWCNDGSERMHVLNLSGVVDWVRTTCEERERDDDNDDNEISVMVSMGKRTKRETCLAGRGQNGEL